MSWYQIWTVSWQVAVFLTPMLVGIAVLWLKSQFVTKADAVVEKNRVDAGFVAAAQNATAESTRINSELRRQEDERDRRWDIVRDQISDHAGRIKAVETDIAKPPSRHTLNNSIATLQGAVNSLGKSVDALRLLSETQNGDTRRQIETLNGYLHTMIEKHLS